MYRYDAIDQGLVDQRVAQFRDQTRRFLAGRADRGRVPAAAPAQRPLHPAPCADAAHRDPLRPAARRASCASSRDIARKYDRGYGHFTTRQNLQLNWPKLEHVPDILAELATRPDARDPDLRQLHPQRHHRPFRRRGAATRSSIRVRTARSSGSGRRCIPSSRTCRASSRSRSPARANDRAAVARCTTSACTLMRNDAGRTSASTCWSAAASAARRSSATSSANSCRSRTCSHYLDAILRVYNRYGRRDNMHKARIKILVKDRRRRPNSRDDGRGRVGAVKDWRRDARPPRRSSGSRAFFTPPPYETLHDIDAAAGREAELPAPGSATTRARTRCRAIARYRCRSRSTACRRAT